MGFLLCLGLANLTSQGCSANANDYCDYSERSVVVLVDTTTQFDGLDRSILMDGLETLYSGLSVGDYLIVYTIPAANNKLLRFKRTYISW